MKARALKALLIITPGVLVALFEWVRHRYLLEFISMDLGNWLTAGLAFLVSLAIVGGLFAALERLRGEAEEKERQLAVFRERDRLASALHDGICQSLFFANVKLKEVEEALERGEVEEARRELREGRAAVREAHDDIRQAVFNLKMARPPAGGLGGTLRDYLTEFEVQTGIRVSMEGDPAGWGLGAEKEGELLSIIKEALWNVRKHAQARHVRLVFSEREGRREVVVADDGRGFEVEEEGEKEGRLGLRIMRDRARALGGEFLLCSRPGEGTRVVLTLPRPREESRVGTGFGG